MWNKGVKNSIFENFYLVRCFHPFLAIFDGPLLGIHEFWLLFYFVLLKFHTYSNFGKSIKKSDHSKKIWPIGTFCPKIRGFLGWLDGKMSWPQLFLFFLKYPWGDYKYTIMRFSSKVIGLDRTRKLVLPLFWGSKPSQAHYSGTKWVWAKKNYPHITHP